MAGLSFGSAPAVPGRAQDALDQELEAQVVVADAMLRGLRGGRPGLRFGDLASRAGAIELLILALGRRGEAVQRVASVTPQVPKKYSPPLARIGQIGCNRGPPSARTVPTKPSPGPNWKSRRSPTSASSGQRSRNSSQRIIAVSPSRMARSSWILGNFSTGGRIASKSE